MVVAIIAILALVAIPTYKSFQARARQKEAQNLLSTYFTAAQAVKAEHGLYPGNFVQTGFAPTGELGYRVRGEDGNDINIALNDNNCWATYSGCTCSGACAGFRTWTEKPLCAVGACIGPTNTFTAACSTLPGPGTTNNTFTVVAAGVINLQATVSDRWAINHQKVLEVCTDGSK